MTRSRIALFLWSLLGYAICFALGLLVHAAIAGSWSVLTKGALVGGAVGGLISGIASAWIGRRIEEEAEIADAGLVAAMEAIERDGVASSSSAERLFSS